MIIKYFIQRMVGELITKPLNSLVLNNTELQLQKKATETTCNYIYENLSRAKVLKSKFEVIDYALKKVSIKDGAFMEFGVYKGLTINYISKKNPKKNVFGFDSFVGLPEDWRDGFSKGMFMVNKLPRVNKNVTLFKGFFEKSIPSFLEKNPISFIQFLHVDSDLYSSCNTIFKKLEEFIVSGSVIVFDEYFNFPGWEKDEFLAFQEFIRRKKLRYRYLAYNKFHEQVAVQLY